MQILNNDGNPDLILGNIADAADFFWNNSHDFQQHSAKTHQFFIIFITADKLNTNSDYPTFIDLDNDSDLDLVIGGYNGLRYYQNIGTISLRRILFLPMEYLI